MAKESWSRSALIWERSNVSRSSIYWDLSNVDNQRDDSVKHDVCSLSYYQYFQHVMAVAIMLRDIILQNLSEIESELHHPSGQHICSIPVAVAIPEGPWLPIAVAAVHLLNEPFLSNSKSFWISISFLPLDPSDGYDRLLHMVHEVHPTVIVSASDTDTAIMLQIVDEIPTKCENYLMEAVMNVSPICVININSLLEDIVLKGENIGKSVYYTLQHNVESYNLHDIWTSFLLTTNNLYQKCNNEDCELRTSHIVFTSGSTGKPKGCVSSIKSLMRYISSKNDSHSISADSVVLLASAISFDPCFSDILATISVRGTIALACRCDLVQNPGHVLDSLSVSHVLCTPTFWSGVPSSIIYSKLRVVALGGEPVPKSLIRSWLDKEKFPHCTFFATYGVTEACVYQTIGKIVHYSESCCVGQDVGIPFTGIGVRICVESRQDILLDVTERGYPIGLGEIVLFGGQIDEISSYFRRPSLSTLKFIAQDGKYHYRTGDRGYIDEQMSHLHVVGRIEGEEGTVKVKGIRVELGEIESSLVDEHTEYTVVTDAIVTAVQMDATSVSTTTTELHAYVVLSHQCQQELGFCSDIPDVGILCSETPLVTLLRERCKRKARVVPSAFILISRVPMSPTGKRYRRGAPPLKNTSPITNFLTCRQGNRVPVLLRDYGRAGLIVADEICNCLNLQICQINSLHTSSTFAMIGGDSLTATRVVRALYARHNKIVDSRFIGGEYGMLDGPFSVQYLFVSKNLGEYVDWLDSHQLCHPEMTRRAKDTSASSTIKENESLVNTYGAVEGAHDSSIFDATVMYEALLQSTSLRYTNIAMALLDVGADPNLQESEGRIGKISDRRSRKILFRSNPLHLACLHGDSRLVQKLLEKQAKYNTPNASSLFPLHLAASGEFHGKSIQNEGSQRLLCIKHLLHAGCPLQLRDGSKQTILHAAARGGHFNVLKFAVDNWVRSDVVAPLDVRDNWGRTPVHWAVLNGHIDVLEYLLSHGCSANPKTYRTSKLRTSVANESPLEICDRIYNNTETAIRMREILQKYEN